MPTIHHQRSKNNWTPAYNSWRCMKQRCNNKKHPSWSRYGGKGISYDPRWETFEAFWNDMGDPPKRGKWDLSRKDHNLSYSLENCEWKPRSDNRADFRKAR